MSGGAFGLLNGAGALWLLLVPALMLLYMLRPRRVRRQVPSLRLWQALPKVEHTRARLRLPPLSLLLILQALALALGALAVAQPALTAPAGRHTVIVLDASGSMQALDSDGSGTATRFDRAKAEARRLASEMEPQDRVTLLRAGAGVTVACAACSAGDLRSAINGLVAGAGDGDIAGALSVAAGLARREPGGTMTATVISDGDYAPLDVAGLPLSLGFVQAGGPVENRSIAAASVRQPPDGRAGYFAYVRVQNSGTQTATVDVSALADTVPLPVRRQTIPAGGQTSITWQVPAGTARFSVSLSPSDALPADDRAVLFLPSAGGHAARVVAPDPSVYVRALSAIEGLAVVTGTGSVSGTSSGVGLTILHDAPASYLPSGGLLVVAPRETFVKPTAQLVSLRPIIANAGHPLLRGVDLTALTVAEALQYTAPDWLETIVTSSQGPLLMAGEHDGRRVVVLAFDPLDSNLPKLAAFPLLMANLVEWLDPLAGVQSVAPGKPVTLAPGATVQTPGGQTIDVGDAGVFAATDEAGVYTVTSGQKGALPLQFAVNMADRGGTGLPAPHPELTSRNQVAGGEQTGTNELWLPFAAAALALLWGEWIVYCWKRGSM